jgi:hypothetical protein
MADWGAESGHLEVSVSGAVAVVTLRRPSPPAPRPGCPRPNETGPNPA